MRAFAARQAPGSPALASSVAKAESADRWASNYRQLGSALPRLTSQPALQSTRPDPDTSDLPVPGKQPRFFHPDLNRIPVHTTGTVVLQAKLAINTPGDEYEQEADHMAEEIVRTPVRALASTAALSGVAPSAAPRLQRECACGGTCSECQKKKQKHEPGKLQRRVSVSPATAFAAPAAAPPIVHQVLRSPGQPLDASTLAFMEPRLGHSLASVRIHTDAFAAQSAEAVHAHAYTVGQHIAFGSNRFSPATIEGRRLLAHELTHVLQQSAAPSLSSPLLSTAIKPAKVDHVSSRRMQRKDSESHPVLNPKQFFEKYFVLFAVKDYAQFARLLFFGFYQHAADPAYVVAVMKEVSADDSDNEDNVAAEFVARFAQAQLNSIAGTAEGRAMFDVLYAAMITGSVSDFEREQSKKLIDARSSQMNPDYFVTAATKGSHNHRTQIFPISNQRVTPGHNDAPLTAKLLPDGQIWVKYPARMQGDFKAEEHTLQGNIFSSEGSVLPPDEIVGVRDYDESGAPTRYVTAVELIDYANQSDRNTLGKIVQVSIAAATLGLAGPEMGAADEAAEETGKWAARLALANKVATGIQVVSFFVHDNRGWLLNTFPRAGRRLIQVTEVADSVVAVFGIAQLGVGGIRLAKNLRSSLEALPGDANQLLDAEQRAAVDNITKQGNELADSLEKNGAAAAKAEEAAGQPTRQLGSVNPDGTPGKTYTQPLNKGPQPATNADAAGSNVGTASPSNAVTTPHPAATPAPARGTGGSRNPSAGSPVHPISQRRPTPPAPPHAPSTSAPPSMHGGSGVPVHVTGPRGPALKIEPAADPVPAAPIAQTNPAAATPKPTPAPGATGAAPKPVGKLVISGAAKVVNNAAKPKVMPQALDHDERKQWKNCNEWHDQYHGVDETPEVDEAAEGPASPIAELKDRISRTTATDQDRVNLCNFLDEKKRVAEAIVHLRRLYIKGNCDRWDWDQQRPRTEAERRQSHQEQLEARERALERFREDYKKYCPPRLSTL